MSNPKENSTKPAQAKGGTWCEENGARDWQPLPTFTWNGPGFISTRKVCGRVHHSEDTNFVTLQLYFNTIQILLASRDFSQNK